MYDFRDFGGYRDNYRLPSEALILNGEYVDEVIEGFRTLSVSGRELLAKDVSSETIPGRNGALFIRSQYPTREITVKYRLKAPTPELFRHYHEQLNELLYGDIHELRFADDTDFFFKGALTSADVPDTGRNTVVASLVFTCFDPFKYSDIKTKTATTSVLTQLELSPYDVLPEYISIDVANATSELTVTHGSKSITIDVGISAGQTVVIGFNPFIITRNGTDITKYLRLSSDYEDFFIESNTPMTTNTGDTITLAYREVRL